MTSAELEQARSRLGLTRAALGAELGLTEETIEAWESGRASIPSSYAKRIRWQAALKERAEALEASGLPACTWVREQEALPVPADGKQQLQQAEAFSNHVKTCSICIARAKYADEHLPPLPPPPLSPLVQGLAAVIRGIDRLPAWARPAAYGAILVGALVLLRAVFFALGHGISVQLVGTVGMALLVGAYMGAVGGVTYGVVRPPLRRLGRAGDYLSGIACTLAYLLAFGIPGAIFSSDPMFRGLANWAIFGALAIVVGLLIGHWWFREATW